MDWILFLILVAIAGGAIYWFARQRRRKADRDHGRPTPHPGPRDDSEDRQRPVTKD